MQMNSRFKTIFSNISYTVIANFVTMLVSVILILLVPKQLSVADYGQWQLYLFYTSYVGFLHFGLCDGIYLRYGGKKYEEIDTQVLGTQFSLLVIYIVCIAIIGGMLVPYIFVDSIKTQVIRFTCVSAVLQLPRSFLTLTLQTTGRIKEYALFSLLDRGVFGVFIIILLCIKCDNVKIYMILDIIAKLGAVTGLCICCRDIMFKFNFKQKSVFSDLKQNVKAGSSLLLGNIASLMIIGVVRFAIEAKWGIESFGKVSLTLSITNFIISFINAVSIVLFPILKNLGIDQLERIYKYIRIVLVATIVVVLNLYYPIKLLLVEWLPQYSETFSYLAIIFPLCLFEAKFFLLANTYLKCIRREKTIFMVNIVAVICSFISTFITVGILQNLLAAVISIVILGMIKSVIAEMALAKYIKINVCKSILKEIAISCIFIIANWFIGGRDGFIIYIVASGLYILFERANISNAIIYVKGKFVK